MSITSMSRRTLLASAATAPLVAGLGASAVQAGGHAQGPQLPRVSRFGVGDFEVTTLLVGSRTVEEPQGIFGMNVDAETFNTASAEALIPTDKAQFFFTPTLVNTGSELILFDTGLNGAATAQAVEMAGHSADAVTHVVLTHMHGDHIGGLMTDGAETFANAAYITGQAEFDHWSGTDNEGFANNVTPLAEKMSFLGDGDSVTSGITAMAAFGHTPGHMTYMLDSGDQQLLIFADLANHYVWSLAHPDWEVRFDMDKEAAAATRRRVLGMLATDKVPFIGYHMPFPGVGYVDTRGDGFHYVPHSYQLLL
ncbi:MBL fold metallo-hydrolase [Marivita hallyeonensis]|uniref:Glyoxylase, beta-lactamase superfamily II n=1 Tax=Marivita hallyeonensis TaxID=996342 RepID=A0A1M5MUC3_9RHOB|nr:MBL fold metallo-hydrolase [Marivita hallyeonensis]SHG80752.1 Glyoxylase, beta-lactamase superfamily II [Marivita hallyeonensis]